MDPVDDGEAQLVSRSTDTKTTFTESRMTDRSNAKVSDGWPSSNARMDNQRGGQAIRSTEI